jgi:hypothetical protein
MDKSKVSYVHEHYRTENIKHKNVRGRIEVTVLAIIMDEKWGLTHRLTWSYDRSSSWAMTSLSSEEYWLSRASRAFRATFCSLVNLGGGTLDLPEVVEGPDEDGDPQEVEADGDVEVGWEVDWAAWDCWMRAST